MSDLTQLDLFTAAHKANRAAAFQPFANDIALPSITVAGVRVDLFIGPSSGKVCVSIDADDTQPWLLRNDNQRSVPMRVCIQGDVVFEG